ncbi:unnamed protein product [Notodromas monacha]|uniref:Protein phosphatase n=1 Tax=Notodromas monacha TaxID=399045 RepID=A0A7R9BCY3_9CRUS|nr:unnamed protein product [Notodromas monacha]CAG0913003.1 unnamed protein product [Notodromas monacha]
MMRGVWSLGGLVTRAVRFAWRESATEASDDTVEGLRLVHAVAGFPKDQVDACRDGRCGDDAYFFASNAHADIMGVADGVGGWRQQGVNPAAFSTALLRIAKRLAEAGRAPPTSPKTLLQLAFMDVRETKGDAFGSSTACLVSLDRQSAILHTANLGDSGVMVVRNGRLVLRSQEQQHQFNTPFQLCHPPPGFYLMISDSPENAEGVSMAVIPGDVILVGTDGVFDNLPDSWLVPRLSALHASYADATAVQETADLIARRAHELSRDANYASPFAVNARAAGFINEVGGKIDDITVLLATVAAGSPKENL